MNFVHIADMHFDSPFVNLSEKDTLGDLRRLEQRKVFKKIIEYIKENQIQYFFISGDLYENRYVKLSTIKFINKLFKEIPKTKIFIAPGNHDPYIKNSYYNKFNWNDNVKIFKSNIEKVETDEANIYGFGFDDFYCTNCNIENINLEETKKPNILVMHGTLDGASIEEKQYNSIPRKELEQKGFDYVALGHIHKLDYNTTKQQRIVYPGSTISLGFDELGMHGMIIGKIENKKLDIEFKPLEDEKFKKIEIDCTNITSKEELIEEINDLKIMEGYYIEIILAGSRNFEIDKYDLLKYIESKQIIKIKNNTNIAYDLEKIANQSTLKGIFVKEMLNRLKNENLTKDEKEKIEKSIEIGLDALK